MCLIAHVGDGQFGPPLHCAAHRHLSRCLFGAGHSVHATGVLTGTHQAAEGQSQSTKAAQLVCADRQGELSLCIYFCVCMYLMLVLKYYLKSKEYNMEYRRYIFYIDI